MDGHKFEIPLPKIKHDVIWNFFEVVKADSGKIFGKCKTCPWEILFCPLNKYMQEHLKLHPNIWNLYLSNLTEVIEPVGAKETKIYRLKLDTLILDQDTNEDFSLRFPLSRIARDYSQLDVAEALAGFNGRIQSECNKNPVGQYAGPYDQNQALGLEIQLPESDLDFEKYTEFIHPDTSNCKAFSIRESYDQFDDLSKINI